MAEYRLRSTYSTLLQGNSDISKNKRTSICDIAQNSELVNLFALSPRHVDHRKCCWLCSTVTSLSCWDFVYNTLAVTQCRAVCLRLLRFVPCFAPPLRVTNCIFIKISGKRKLQLP